MNDNDPNYYWTPTQPLGWKCPYCYLVHAPRVQSCNCQQIQYQPQVPICINVDTYMGAGGAGYTYGT